MKFNKFTAILFTGLIAVTALGFNGCSDEKNTTVETTATSATTAQATTQAVDSKLVKEISDCVAKIAKADKTNALKDELEKYPKYYYNNENGFASLNELKDCIKKYFYTCDTEYKVLSAVDVTDEKKSEIETDLKENFGAKLDVEQVALADIDYKYTNYSTDDYIDDLDFKTESQYFIKVYGKWYYGWGLDLNSEHYEYEAEK